MPNMIASALAEEMFFLQMEEDATFITSTLEVIQSLELKYSTLPVITELDKMDEDQPSKLDIMDQSSPNLDMVMLDQDLNNNLPGQSHSTTPGPPAMRERGSWWPAGWYPDNWFSSSSSQPMSPPRTGGTGRRIRKASGPSSPDLTRFSSSPNMFCTVNC